MTRAAANIVSVLSQESRPCERSTVRSVVTPLLLSLPLIEACSGDGTGAVVAARATRAAVTTGLRALGYTELAARFAAATTVAELRPLVEEALMRLDEEETS